MLVSRKVLCAVYVVIALVALIATWSQNILFFNGGGSFLGFWQATKVNPASRSITVDIALFLLSVAILMVIEARRVGVKFVWAYIVAGVIDMEIGDDVFNCFHFDEHGQLDARWRHVEGFGGNSLDRTPEEVVEHLTRRPASSGSVK